MKIFRKKIFEEAGGVKVKTGKIYPLFRRVTKAIKTTKVKLSNNHLKEEADKKTRISWIKNYVQCNFFY